MRENKVINLFQQHLWWMLLLFIVILQIPFLEADPDLYLSHSRDAHSDEGLNTIQIRNYINQGYLDPWECDNLMKNPLFNLILFIPFKIFGTKLLVARLTVLFFMMAVLFFIGLHKPWRKWLLFVTPIVFLQFHIFQYMHFGLAETMSIGCILMGMFGFVQMWDQPNTTKKLLHLIMAISFIMFSWFMKIQFLYVVGMAATVIFIYLIYDVIKNKRITKQLVFVTITALVYASVLALIYYKFWYLKYKEPFEYIMKNQTGGRFDLGIYFWQIIGENLTRYFSTQYVKPLWIAFVVAFPLGIFTWIKVKNKLYKRIFLFSMIWVLFEVHKIAIHHVPSRYLLSGYASMLVLTGSVLFGLGCLAMEREGAFFKNLYRVFFVGMIVLTATHLYNYATAFNRRTYRVKELNNYMYHYDRKNMVVIGPWAPTVTWNTKMRSFPVWKDFLNDKDIKNKYHPDIVVMEPGEADSDGAFCADNFDIVNEADSVKKTWIGKWPVHIYWMKK